MNTKIKKIIILNLPCFAFGLMSTKVCKAWRLSEGYEISDKFLNFSDSFSKVFQSPLPSFNIKDLMFGISIAVILRFVIYVKSKNSKKYRKGIEYGSAQWSA